MSRCVPPAMASLLLAASCLATADGTPDVGKEYTHSIAPPPAGLDRAAFELWLPASIGPGTKVRGVIAASDYHAGRDIYTDPRWRALAARLRFAMLRHNVTHPVAQRKLAKDAAGLDAILAAMKHFAKESGHPEIEHAGIVHTGLSQSGHQATAFCNVRPDRAIAAVPYHSSAAVRDPNAWQGEGRLVPQLHVIAERDQFLPPATIHEFVLRGRGKGALWAALFQAQVEHHRLGDPDFILAWVEEVVKLRVPEDIPADKPCPLKPLAEKDGYLGVLKWGDRRLAVGDDAATVAACAGFRGDKAGAHWLPTEALAKAWRAYSLRRDARDPVDYRGPAPAGATGSKAAANRTACPAGRMGTSYAAGPADSPQTPDRAIATLNLGA